MPTDLPSLGKMRLQRYSLDLDYFLGHNYDDISVACEELPPVIEWVNVQLQSVIEDKLVKSQEIKEEEAKVYFDLRNGRFIEEYGGKMTEVALERAVILDKGVKERHREYAILVGWASRLQNLQNSLSTKLDLIRSSEATRRKVFSQQETDKE
jgi:hypothetical protein